MANTTSTDSLIAILPDTPSVKATLKFIRPHLDDVTYNHVVRSALFSIIIANNLTKEKADTHLLPADLEVSAVAALLHDMAWNPNVTTSHQFVSKDKRFEVDGANAARSFLQSLPEDHGWDRRRIQLVWDAIALHATFSISFHKEPEVVLCNYGIFVDVLGVTGVPPLPGIPTSCAVSRPDFDKVYSGFPSLHMGAYLREAMCALCKEKPETTYDNFVAQFGEEYVEGFTSKGMSIVQMVSAREEIEKNK